MRMLAVIMAGGGGTRLWPASTPQRPKQLFDPLLRGQSLLRRTVGRLEGLVKPDDVMVVTAVEQASSVATALPSLEPWQILAEPVGRNTAPCVALAARTASGRGFSDDTIMVALPADAFVADDAGFRDRLVVAARASAQHQLIATLGITPTSAHTGYGYIERRDTAASDGVFDVRRFVEKPDAPTAEQFLKAGNFLWNAGIFVMPLSVIREAFARHCPSTWAALGPVEEALLAGGDATSAIATAYPHLETAPIDTAVMEKLDRLLVVPADVGWTDLGSWGAVYDIAEADAHGNAILTGSGAPPSAAVDSQGCLVWAEDARVGVLGLQDVAVIVSDGRVLVCPRDRTEEVRRLVDELSRK